jgi:hypothetical protein
VLNAETFGCDIVLPHKKIMQEKVFPGQIGGMIHYLIIANWNLIVQNF